MNSFFNQDMLGFLPLSRGNWLSLSCRESWAWHCHHPWTILYAWTWTWISKIPELLLSMKSWQFYLFTYIYLLTYIYLFTYIYLGNLFLVIWHWFIYWTGWLWTHQVSHDIFLLCWSEWLLGKRSFIWQGLSGFIYGIKCPEGESGLCVWYLLSW